MNIDTTTPQITLTLNGESVENYNNLLNKPQINGVTLSGNLTTEDLGIVTDEENWELLNSYTSDIAFKYCVFTSDSNGADFSLQKFRLIYDLNGSSSMNNGRVGYSYNPQDSEEDNISRLVNYNATVYYQYNGVGQKCIVESAYQYEGLGTILVNFGRQTGKFLALPNNRWGNVGSYQYAKTAPFNCIATSWGTPCTGSVELWGVRTRGTG